MDSDSASKRQGFGLGNSRKPRQGQKKQSRLTPMADVLQVLLTNGKSQLGDGFVRWRLEQEWLAVVGETIAAQTAPCSLERGILWIWVRHSTWMQQLWFFKDAIKDKVNGHLGKTFVEDVRFTLNRRAIIKQPEKQPEK